jgi:hypothetical protein
MLVTMTWRTPGSFPDVDDALTRSEGTPSGLDVYQGRPLRPSLSWLLWSCC